MSNLKGSYVAELIFKGLLLTPPSVINNMLYLKTAAAFKGEVIQSNHVDLNRSRQLPVYSICLTRVSKCVCTSP